MKLYVPWMVLLVAHIQKGSSLKCYSMDEDSQLAIELCPVDKDYCMTVLKSGEDKYVGCNTYGDIQEEGCREDTSMIVCFCDSDFCNGSNQTSLGTPSILLSLALFLHNTYG
ncbi:uncharacterized protein [Lepeophtheirus salmonis]|uniref:uncharacterized protein n=1 Tax=Lepeophtheirus salmonis TaxID=72036 RepID=UPI001AE0F268|nr:uncharacterized protein LOC121123862 [Lepeophtheirus salmonis]